MLTLVGTGGVGKTRLALEIARSARADFPDGAWLVELAALTQGSFVTQAVADTLSTPVQSDRSLLTALSETINTRRVLLILDNCEHLLGPCSELAGFLLSLCPELRILATSREPLGIAGELVWHVPPFPVPGAGDGGETIESFQEFDSVQLFILRAGAVSPEFAVTTQRAQAITNICRQLDGIPLALELAAAWVRTLSVDQIAARLDDRFELLTGGGRSAVPRQQTLRGAVSWSYELLAQDERVLFDRLAVFAGSFTLEAVEAICGGEQVDQRAILRLVARLVDVSLVVVEERDGQKRFRLLESLRMFGREHLATSGDPERIFQRHAEHFLSVAEEAAPELWGPDLTQWLERLNTDHDDLRAALRWAVGRGEAETALRLATALARFWQIRGHLYEGLQWLERGLVWTAGVTTETRTRALDAAGFLARDLGDYERAGDFYAQALLLRRESNDDLGVAHALNNLGVIAQFQGDYEQAVIHHTESLELFRKSHDQQGIGLSLLTLGVMEQVHGDIDRAVAWCEEALGHFRTIDDRHGIAAAINNLGNLASVKGEYDRAADYYDESLAFFRGMGDKREIAACLHNLSAVARDRGDLNRARIVCHESLLLSIELGDTWRVAAGFKLAGQIAAADGDFSNAVRFFSAAMAASTSVVDDPAKALQSPTEEVLAELRLGLGADAFEIAWAEGRGRSNYELVQLVLVQVEEVPANPVSVSVTLESGGLTRRELEVAALIPTGLTNREIADALFISERTADTHVQNIFSKLGLRSRSQVATWVVEQGLKERE